MKSAKVIIEVVAGLIIDNVDPQYTRHFTIDSEQWEKPDEIMKVYGHAMEYQRNLWDPSRINWVRSTWIYL